MRGLDKARLHRLQSALDEHVERGDVPGLVWLLALDSDVELGTAGALDLAHATPVARNAVFRISSMTKPVTAVATLVLVDEGRLRLDDPVDDLLPELANRRVLATPGGTFDDAVPAHRSITVRDLLTFRVGLGTDLTTGQPQPVMARAAELELGVGPPAPATVPHPDEYLRRLGTLPLEYQPGTRWLYHTGADVLGVLVARASGQPFDRFLSERVFVPLGMSDTGFWVPRSSWSRFGPSYVESERGVREVYDPTNGQWSQPPKFASGGAGLVSTADDYLAFATMLLRGGATPAGRILSSGSVAAMTTGQITDAQAMAGLDPTGARTWGFGVAVQLRPNGFGVTAGSYGWNGGMGTTWTNDPSHDMVAILLTNQLWTSPTPPPVAEDFLTYAYAALDT